MSWRSHTCCLPAAFCVLGVVGCHGMVALAIAFFCEVVLWKKVLIWDLGKVPTCARLSAMMDLKIIIIFRLRLSLRCSFRLHWNGISWVARSLEHDLSHSLVGEAWCFYAKRSPMTLLCHLYDVIISYVIGKLLRSSCVVVFVGDLDRHGQSWHVGIGLDQVYSNSDVYSDPNDSFIDSQLLYD